MKVTTENAARYSGGAIWRTESNRPVKASAKLTKPSKIVSSLSHLLFLPWYLSLSLERDSWRSFGSQFFMASSFSFRLSLEKCSSRTCVHVDPSTLRCVLRYLKLEYVISEFTLHTHFGGWNHSLYISPVPSSNRSNVFLRTRAGGVDRSSIAFLLMCQWEQKPQRFKDQQNIRGSI